MKNVVFCLLLLVTEMAFAGKRHCDDDCNYNIKDKVAVEEIRYDTVTLDLPYAEIKDKRLRSVIDSLRVVDENNRSFDENVFICLYHLGGDDFAAWAITPSLPPMGRVWGIAYHKVGNLYVIFSAGMKEYLKIATNRVASMTLVVEVTDIVSNVDYIWTGTIREPEAKRKRNIIRLDPAGDKLSINKVSESVSDIRGVKAKTPYGDMEFSDDDNSSLLLNRFAKASGYYYADSLNTRAIISVCDVADGAIADMMGYICRDDFCNKPKLVIDLFARNEKDLEKYIDCIATELYMDGTASGEEYFGKLRKQIRDKDDAQVLDRILSKIKERYSCFKTK